jgi:ADP-dependent NAD(P)H-hydrate dehydratase / NAD(P)H-hydrate epimerase
MKAATRAQMRELDARTIREAGIPGATLMDRAGRGVARLVRWCTPPDRPTSRRRCLMVAGKGNNGGDVFAAARHLQSDGYTLKILLTGPLAALRGDALTHFAQLPRSRIEVKECATAADWAHPHAIEDFEPDILVDGILGTGLQGPACGIAALAIEILNESGRRRPVVAIDLPSGLDADAGTAAGPVIRADATATLGYPKRGFLSAAALPFLGHVEVVDIGIPRAWGENLAAHGEMIARSDVARLLRPFPCQAHKGNRGHTLIIGGSRGFAGAAGLAARAALRSGTGLVSVLVPQSVAPLVGALAPAAMVHFGAETADGRLDARAWPAGGRRPQDFDAVLLGPGMGNGPHVLAHLQPWLKQTRVPVVLDADALNACADHADILAGASAPLTLTPHPGEAARLLACTAAEVQADRDTAVRRLTRHGRCVAVLKGAGTLVCEPDGGPHVNLTGNPGMGCGGTGDALAGLLTGLLAQGYRPFDAARIAVYLHGLAGDGAARDFSQPGMTACDLIDRLPRAWHDTTTTPQ